MMRYAQVKNIHNTSGHTPEHLGYSTWKEFWETNMNQSFGSCANRNCTYPAEVGGHVIRTDIPSKRWYILPLCKHCNHFGNDTPFFADASTLCPENI